MEEKNAVGYFQTEELSDDHPKTLKVANSRFQNNNSYNIHIGNLNEYIYIYIQHHL